MKGSVELKILNEVDTNIAIITEKVCEPSEFFIDRKGLFVYGSFKELVLKDAKTGKSGTGYSLESFDLVRNSTDEMIELALENKNIFSETDVCAILAHLIDAQPDGKEGYLLVNGYRNLFYTPSAVVSVCWRGVAWRVFAWQRGDGAWCEGRRVFSPATGS